MAGKQLVQGCYEVAWVGVEPSTFESQGRTLSTEPRRPVNLEIWATKSCTKRKPTCNFSILIQSFAVGYVQPFGRNFDVKFPFDLRFEAYRVDLWGRKWYQLKCRPHIPIRLLYTQYTHRLAIIYNATDRQLKRR